MGDRRCRPLGFLIGLPFAVLALLVSLIGAVIWLIGSALNCICPCCTVCSWVANMAMRLIQLPISVVQWFIDTIPC
ncbi:hypothetical protein AXF42_Ash005939 [Apostasia shenzhenica]|uniref:Uncharacterized protein n=1 Tax=Apostasia shenzhenica TaxID=1088818 RepID=A0A2I0AZR3_9ASPA|nr:hypothetical protein AXF42_Ash005939 [Apostasia shenzhenica]